MSYARLPRALAPWLLAALLLSGAARGGAVPTVTTAPLATLTFLPEFSAPAIALTLNDSRIASETAGRVARIPVRVGDAVEPGQTLVELDCADNQLRRRQAEAVVAAARAAQTLAGQQATRARTLVRGRSVSEELQNQRDAELAQAQAQAAESAAALDAARLEVERCRIPAPFRGRVVERLVAEGERVALGNPAIRLVDDQRLEVAAQVGIDAVVGFQAAADYRFEAAGESFPLRLRGLVPVIDPLGRNREARLEIPEARPLPGTSGRLVWRAQGPHLPADLPQRRGGRIGVFILEEGRARFHELPGAREGLPAVVDLPPDTAVILEGREGLQDGDALSIGPPGASR